MSKPASSKKSKNDSNDTLEKSIERAFKDIENGRVTAHKLVMKKYKKWLSNQVESDELKIL